MRGQRNLCFQLNGSKSQCDLGSVVCIHNRHDAARPVSVHVTMQHQGMKQNRFENDQFGHPAATLCKILHDELGPACQVANEKSESQVDSICKILHEESVLHVRCRVKSPRARVDTPSPDRQGLFSLTSTFDFHVCYSPRV